MKDNQLKKMVQMLGKMPKNHVAATSEIAVILKKYNIHGEATARFLTELSYCMHLVSNANEEGQIPDDREELDDLLMALVEEEISGGGNNKNG